MIIVPHTTTKRINYNYYLCNDNYTYIRFCGNVINKDVLNKKCEEAIKQLERQNFCKKIENKKQCSFSERHENLTDFLCFLLFMFLILSPIIFAIF